MAAPKSGSKARYAGIGSDAVERATGRSWEAWIETLERRVDVLEFIEIVKAANLDPVELMERVLKGVGG